MSPAAKSKCKDKSAAKAVKEQHKASSKPSATPVNAGNGIAASAYNPVSGTFHALETGPSASLPTPQSNGRFRTIDETEEQSGSSLGTAAEYDSVSNNDDSCSGESEDQQKEKPMASVIPKTAEPIPGSDTDKREKIRQKNERKHQRQRERRAQELHERCCSYLTSRKLEALAQNLVAMGFSSEQATMALIQNDGRVDESAIWLLEGSEEIKRQTASNLDGVNPKIDIADELAKIADMELTYKCSKQEVERVVVACEGDLEKAEEAMKAPKQEPAVVSPKLEEAGDHPTASANGFHNNRTVTPAQISAVRLQLKGGASASVQQQRRDERDFNYAKGPVIAGASQMEAPSRSLQPSIRKVQLQSKPDWTKAQAASLQDKRWPGTSSNPSTPFSLPSPLQVAAAQTKPEAARYAPGSSEIRSNILAGTLRDPIIVMQRPQSSSAKHKHNQPSTNTVLSASPPASTGWYPNGSNAMEMMKLANGGLGHQLRNLAFAGSSSQQFYPQSQHHQFISGPVDSGAPGWGSSSWSMPGASTRTTSSSSLAVPSSLGLFTGWGSNGSSGSSSPVDWSTRGSMPQCDYTSIDWSLNSTPLSLPSSIKGERLYDNSWHASYTTPKETRPVANGVGIAGLQDGSLMVDHPSPSAGSHEWTSPFAGKDLFRAPRQFVTSPSP